MDNINSAKKAVVTSKKLGTW
ncbi:hypothetical protein CCACVL1_04461 [Corchorus capsularis]|uniref:Uncharacterized protein n=1 Tax=Corchorus capsularis TaxID=210143 RepID=A0A1R3JSF5_COCAP|nr:hypothetical protein CCACVL1_04461 [Corchorus capsularis]